jgi:circadian clock protein KaiC
MLVGLYHVSERGFMQNDFNDEKCSTGVEGMDEILGGGFPCFSLYAIQGEPGSGKTTFALQFLMEGVKRGHKVLYITFSETKKELEKVARSHRWDLTKIDLMDLTLMEKLINPDEQNSLFHPSDIELNQVSELIMQKIDEITPTRIVFDSISEMRLLAETPLRYRRQILSLKQLLAKRDTTVLFLDDLSISGQDLQIHSIAHGVINLTRMDNEFGGERRRLRVMKLRGVSFIGGYHDFEIKTGGLIAYPRITSANHPAKVISGQLKSGSAELDSLLGGGLDRGTASLLIGPAGTSKSTLALKYALSATAKGEKAIFFTFDETIGNLCRRSESIGMKVSEEMEKGTIKIQKVDPAELSPGAFAGLIQKAVKEEGYSVVVIDSLNGYIQAMPQEEFLVLQLHELLAYLNNLGVVTIMTLAQQGMIGNMNSPVDLTYLADTVVLTRFFEARGSIRKAISVIKKRTGSHESTIREFTVGTDGLHVGVVLEDFEGVLTGVPRYNGKAEKIMMHK